MGEPVKGIQFKPDVAEKTQALVATGFGKLPFGRALFLDLSDCLSGAWLKDLDDITPITPASQVGSNTVKDQAAAIAFTWTGLSKLGVPEAALASFSSPFQEGMFQDDRLRRLGDKRAGKWLDTTGKKKPRWSGNTPSGDKSKKPTPYTVVEDDEVKLNKTDVGVHVALMIYARKEQGCQELVRKLTIVLHAHGISIAHQLPIRMEKVAGIHSEHFGFADGISQPKPFDEDGVVLNGNSTDDLHGVPLGEFLIGYKNGHHEVPPGPVVISESRSQTNRPEEAGLPEHPKAKGFFDLGKNGSYLVVRELFQDVAAFWNSMDSAAGKLRDQDPKTSEVTGEWLAERVVGRTRKGEILRPNGPMKVKDGADVDNEFRFFTEDQHGYGCPIGSHVRRANPRDTLAPEANMKDTLLSSANNHRILRRGRIYGPRAKDERNDDGEDRGLLFMCLNTDIARQFEFIQQTWLLNSDFGTLFEEVDPLIGPDGWMTLPEKPFRRRAQVQTFVEMRGGEYFFLPSMAALKYLAML